MERMTRSACGRMLMLIFICVLSAFSSFSQERFSSRPARYITESMLRKRIITTVMPEFPQAAIERGITGIVKSKIEFNQNGEVIRATVDPAIDPVLRKAVFVAIKKWKFATDVFRWDEPDATTVARLTFLYSIEAGRPCVAMYTPPPGATVTERLDYADSGQEFNEWIQWSTPARVEREGRIGF